MSDMMTKFRNSGYNVNALRTNATLTKDEWIVYDKAMVQAATKRLVGVGDLMSRGLVYNPGTGMGASVLQFQTTSDMNEATISMDGATRGENDAVAFELGTLPLPINHKDWQISARMNQISQRDGMGLDTTQVSAAARKVAEKTESMLFNGAGGFTFGGGTLYGYIDQPNGITGNMTADWASATGVQILGDVIAMKQELLDNKKWGPFMLYVSPDYETKFDNDYQANYSKTLRQRILEVSSIIDVKVIDSMPAKTAIMVNMDEETVRMVNPLAMTNVEWEIEGGFISKFKTLEINVPQVRAGEDGVCGVVVYTVAP